MAQLNTTVLSAPPPGVAVPTYDPAALVPGIVHFGVGGFHRAHQAMYLDRLLNLGGFEAWGICGVGVLPGDVPMRDVLARQENLYTLLSKAPGGGVQARVIGALCGFLYAPDDPEAVIERLADPQTRVVSLTITEGGYGINNATGEFEAGTPELRHDLGPGAPPKTAFGLIVAGLRRRRARGLGALTVVSCDNMPHNGRVTRRALVAFARLQDPDLADWIAEHVAFPSSMVDRITPVTTDETRREVREDWGLDDAWPVVAEGFCQWVLEDDFAAGRPPLERVGVQLVSDVEPHELMKLRLLNGGHQALGYLGLLGGHTLVHEAARDPAYAEFLLDYMALEATPTLPPVPGVDLGAYRRELILRFGNPAIADTLERLVAETSERVPKFLLPVVARQVQLGGELRRCALVVAAWSMHLQKANGGEVPRPPDPRAAELAEAARLDAGRPGAFLDLPDVFGDLGAQPRFRAAYVEAHGLLRRAGPHGALRALASTSARPR